MHKLITKNSSIIKSFYLINIFFLFICFLFFSTINQYKTFFIQKNNLTKHDNAVLFNYLSHQVNNQIAGVSYINNGEMLDRQINNNNLQTFIDDAKGSVLKLNDLSDATNNKTYSYDVYGNFISGSSFKKNNEYRVNLTLIIPNNFEYNGERFDHFITISACPFLLSSIKKIH